MNEFSMKNISTLFFIGFLMLVALQIPTSALLNNPIFYNDNIQTFNFTNTPMKIYRSQGFYTTNILNQQVFIAQEEDLSEHLYDLYLGFEQHDFTNNYSVIKNNYITNRIQFTKGTQSAKFVAGDNGIILFPKDSSILKNNTASANSFTISFSLYPYSIGEGTYKIVSYEDHDITRNKLQTHGFVIKIENSIVSYHFNNYFVDSNGKLYTFVLQEKEPLINNKWEDHTLILDTANNIIKIYRNGIEQDLIFIRQEQHRYAKPLQASSTAQLSNVPLIIGNSGVFSMDEFVIYRDVVTSFIDYKPNQQLFMETDVLNMSTNISALYEMDIDASDLTQNYRLAYRFSDRYFLPNTETRLLPWVYIDPKKKSMPPSYSTGQFIQWRVEYYTPLQKPLHNFYIKNIFARYRETADPGVVWINSIIAKDGRVDISWKPLPNQLVQSYEIYYGEKPNHYFGKSSIPSATSPISIEISSSSLSENMEYILEGLQNEKQYFFSIRAKDIYGQYGPFSPEISVRPSSVNSDFGYSIGR